MSFNQKKIRDFFLEKGIEILYDFSQDRKFNNGDVIFKDRSGKVYTVNELIKKIKELIDFIELTFDTNLDKYKRALNILKLGILFLNNQQYHKPKKDDVIECIKIIMELENRTTEEINSVVMFIKTLNGVWVNE